MGETAKSSCEQCAFRARYDRNPRSFLGRLWRWHAFICPGWKKYMRSLSDEERRQLAARYRLAKYM
ncbi:MAG: hypothetical protein JXR96_13470 [Deltaproteobacteria bacterium]|nr:hypothetical protein [Deltaproteobacteria bacterium]